MDINKEALERAINRTYPGLTMYVRDANLRPEQAAQYKAGLMIRERGFTDASCRVMGMVTSHRYAILSNHMADLQEYEHGTNWGQYVAQKDSHFKVLGTHNFNGKMMIVLLHLPDDATWRLFENITINVDKEILASCIERFEKKALAAPVPELQTQDWLDRCKYPIGMDDEARLFDLG